MNDKWNTYLPVIAAVFSLIFCYYGYQIESRKSIHLFKTMNYRIYNLKLIEVSNAIYTKKGEPSWLKTLLLRFKMKKEI